MLRAEWLSDQGRKIPFIGRAEELEVLRREVSNRSRSRWLITGEAGSGKTRLMQEVGLSFGDRCRFFKLRGAGGPGEEPFELVPELEKGEAGESLLIFDDVDACYPTDLPMAGRMVERIVDGPIFMTARSEEIWFEWERFAPITHRMHLGDLSEDAVHHLLGAMALPPHEIAALRQQSGLGRSPRMLLEYVEALQFVQAGSELETVLAPDGQPLRATGDLRRVEISVREVNDALMAAIKARPELMHELSPRKFEEFVAELYSRSGFEVKLTPASKDGGVDVYAVQRAPFGSFLTVIDCKRYRADRPVEVGLVRKLYGAVMDTDASTGVIATTSYFTKGARTFQEQRQHRIGLQDFASLKRMLWLPPERR